MPVRFSLFFLIIFCFWACTSGPSPPLSPAAEKAAFQLDEAFQIELVAAEPLVQDPVAMSFDEDGRLWVVEMLGFMPDIDGTGEDDRVGRVAVLTDLDGDGRMDERTTFLDSLVLPRALAVVKGGALVAERVSLWFVQDTNADLKADLKTLVDSEYGGRGMPEHSANGLWRGMDNWHYNAKSSSRYRFTDQGWVQEETEFRGQWGICHDNVGRLYYNYNWSQLHADLVPPNYLSRNSHHTPSSGIDHGLTVDRKIYPIRANTAVNRGYIPGTLDEEGKLKEFASACSPLIYRGHAFTKEFQGNAFVCDPTANLVKRNLIREEGFELNAFSAYEAKEFLTSTDERFRPVFLASGPDGALYITDMYRGIIQHGPYMTPYLREETLKRKLDQPVNLGRIWRIIPKDWQRPVPEKLSLKSSGELVALLGHPNGWHRDMAQRLLVERKDINAVPQLTEMALSANEPLARLQALWTLEGLGNSDHEIYFQALTDTDPFVQAAALRLLEPLAQQKTAVMERLESLLPQIYRQALPPAILQITLTAGILGAPAAIPLLEEIISIHHESPVIRDGVMSSLKDWEYAMLIGLQDRGDWQDYSSEKEIFLETLSTAIVKKAASPELKGLIDLLGIRVKAEDWGWQEKTILRGMSLNSQNPDSPIAHLSAQPKLFSDLTRFEKEDSNRIANISSLFSWPGKVINQKTPAGNELKDKGDLEKFALGRQQYLTYCSGCHGTNGTGLPRYAPPLVNSEWVIGDDKRLILILLHGMEGPVTVDGKNYDAPDILPVMPALPLLGDQNISAILTYIRNDWGNLASPVPAGLVSRLRHRSQGKITPWKAADLTAHSFETIIDELD